MFTNVENEWNNVESKRMLMAAPCDTLAKHSRCSSKFGIVALQCVCVRVSAVWNHSTESNKKCLSTLKRLVCIQRRPKEAIENFMFEMSENGLKFDEFAIVCRVYKYLIIYQYHQSFRCQRHVCENKGIVERSSIGRSAEAAASTTY